MLYAIRCTRSGGRLGYGEAWGKDRTGAVMLFETPEEAEAVAQSWTESMTLTTVSITYRVEEYDPRRGG
ncbi:MAG: hypothetical protein ACYSVY_22285 [Planctomycetota bacterium]|jgi:hypothetical protein